MWNVRNSRIKSTGTNPERPTNRPIIHFVKASTSSEYSSEYSLWKVSRGCGSRCAKCTIYFIIYIKPFRRLKWRKHGIYRFILPLCPICRNVSWNVLFSSETLLFFELAMVSLPVGRKVQRACRRVSSSGGCDVYIERPIILMWQNRHKL